MLGSLKQSVCGAFARLGGAVGAVVRKGKALLVTGSVGLGLAVSGSAYASEPQEFSIPDMGVDFQEVTTKLGEELGTIIGLAIGLAVAVLVVRKGVQWLRRST